jgi:integrase
LFATAIYAGLRKGELLALRKEDVDLDARLLNVARSHQRDTTKGGHADAIPIAAELVPYLRAALKSSPSELMFPKEDGSMMSPDVAVESVLRRAMARAGIVTGYRHVCRKKGCAHAEAQPDARPRRCPQHGALLWPKPQVRTIRFHDLRHTTASLLMMAGANPGAVQRILRRTDPKITTEVYGHLAPEYLRAEVDRLSFRPKPQPDVEETPAMAAGGEVLGPFVTRLLPGSDFVHKKAPGTEDFSFDSEGFKWSGRQDSNLRPLGPEPSALPG